MLNPESYDGARVLEASGRPMLVIGRSYVIGLIQVDETVGGTELTEEIGEVNIGVAGAAGTKSIAYLGGKAAGTKLTEEIGEEIGEVNTGITGAAGTKSIASLGTKAGASGTGL